jgi:hypothetical protein
VDTDAYGLGGKVEEKRDLLVKDATTVLACVEKARSLVRTERVFLMGGGFGGFLAHFIWNNDNRSFLAFMALNTETYPSYPTPGPDVDRAKPVYVWTNRRTAEEARKIGECYKSAGFENVDVRGGMRINDVNQLNDMVYSQLLGEGSVSTGE